MTQTTQRKILQTATQTLNTLQNQFMNILEICRPTSLDYAFHLKKVVSKLSPFVSNMLEYQIIQHLNSQKSDEQKGKWIRQDPGFPDATFQSSLYPAPGIEIKTWFPLATEITARFKNSQSHFHNNNIDVAIIAWLPENLIWGRPKILDILIVSALSIAQARDNHYHNPPDYIILEPENTKKRTKNLRQTNTNGYKLQLPNSYPIQEQILRNAHSYMQEWSMKDRIYDPSPEYQAQLRRLMKNFTYRGDTNYAKIDRIQHKALEQFKTQILNRELYGRTIREWKKGINHGNEKFLRELI